MSSRRWPKRRQRPPEQDENLIYIDISSIDRKTKRIVSPKQMTGQEAPSRARQVVRSGDVLVSMTRPSLNAVAMVTEELDGQFASTGFDVLRSLIVNPKWIFYLVQTPHFIESMSDLVKGVVYPAIRTRDVRNFEIPIAPVNEQKRIVNKLENLIVRVDVCRDRLAKAESVLKVIRNSIFNAATTGDLTREWVYTDQPETWQDVKLEDLLVDKPRNGYSPRAVDYETKTCSLTLTATTSGKFDPHHIKYIDEDIPEDSHLWLEPEDILIQRANSLEYVGVSAIYDGPSKGYIYPDLMMKCRANDRVLTDYLYYLLSSSRVRSYFRKNATGTTGNMPKINQKIVLSVPVSIPPVDEQKEIVRRAKMLLAHVERLESYYDHARSKINKITSSLLFKAFSGELMPQHLNDESASDLLRRILLLKENTESKVAKTNRSKKTTSNIKSNLDMLKRNDIQPNHLSAILRKSGAMQPENLWSSCNYSKSAVTGRIHRLILR